MNVIDTLEYTSYFSATKSPSIWGQLRAWWSKRVETPREVSACDPATYSPCEPARQLDAYKVLLTDARAIYVFRNGTAVYSAEAMSKGQALELMQEYGPVRTGEPAGDFFVAAIESPVAGFVVKYAHPQIVSFAGSDEYPPDCPTPMAGSMIRLSRDMDSRDLHLVAQWVADGK